VAYTYGKLIDFAVDPLFIVPIICLFAWLLVSEIPMFSLKFKRFGWNENKRSYVFLTCCLILIVLFGLAGLSACILLYIVLSIFSAGSVKKEK
jgi:CDP-diacylglycerol--serine O-phosphatidyltransferase